MSDENYRSRRYSMLRDSRRRRNSYYERRRGDRLIRRTQSGDTSIDFHRLIAVENLEHVYDRLRRDKGGAPGLDGITYDDLSRSEMYAVLRQLSRALRDGSYTPHPARQVRIPKGSGSSYRTLRLRVICDRIVATAITDMLTPLLDGEFLAQSYGFRPRLSTWDMLADLSIDAAASDRWVIVTDDIANAFDCVRIASLMDAMRQRIHDDRLISLIETITRGGAPSKRTAIDQGSALSPLELNLLLHDSLDRQMAQDARHMLWYRYADNLGYLCRSVSEGSEILRRVTELLTPIRMRLKGQDGPPIDLRSGSLKQILGFAVRHDVGRLAFEPGDRAWQNLRKNLLDAHTTRSPLEYARMTVRGWIEAYGPAFREPVASTTSRRIINEAATLGFRELAAEREIVQWATDAHHAWLRLLERRKRI